MNSQRFELKEQAIALRQSGMSLTGIEKELHVPRSTLSGWLKTVALTPEQVHRLQESKRLGLEKARLRAAEAHRAGKALRLLDAKKEALETLSKIELSSEVLDLAFSMLYFGGGGKAAGSAFSSSDARTLRFTLAVLQRNYGMTSEMFRCELRLRGDQEAEEAKCYWSQALGLSLENFTTVIHDKRADGPTYPSYKGVCVLRCRSTAIQRKLGYLYTLFCDKVATLK